MNYFYSRPCGRGDGEAALCCASWQISTHAPAGGATEQPIPTEAPAEKFLLTPLREGRLGIETAKLRKKDISTHAPAGGATEDRAAPSVKELFLLTPLREGRRRVTILPCRGDAISTHAPAGGATFATHFCHPLNSTYFYSRPCGRGDGKATRVRSPKLPLFLLTPLREGRRFVAVFVDCARQYFYSRPCGRGDSLPRQCDLSDSVNFYSRPCGRGDSMSDPILFALSISTHAPAGGATVDRVGKAFQRNRRISTHAPAGGATAIFHKSVMRFCGKLPKDDTVLCLASFGFPRRDPKAVYLAWISCANLPQKCVRQGLALKDQGTSCFHEGLASHAFDPVLV